ncbi:DUF6714 family protein [Thiofilum flexile]|uniref:DUF6714 family protein n=1 Tax=Thiofilum flexile TaxID=125627 RepID=UPI000374BC20|nr:DUF6714 family protein [Thiofilum flexile]
MNQDDQMLQMIRAAFADCPRPEHFTNYQHCEECYEHDETLRNNNLETLSIEQVGNTGWDPICFISPAGFVYYFPALARIALAESLDYPYLLQLLFHLNDPVGYKHRLHCTPVQRKAVIAFLGYIIDSRAELLDHYDSSDEALSAWGAWASAPKTDNT